MRLRESINRNASLTEIQTAAMCLLAFLRFDELMKLQDYDTVFQKDYRVVRITSSKTEKGKQL